jgi:hypothetical protein
MRQHVVAVDEKLTLGMGVGITVGDCVATVGDCVATVGDCVATEGDCVATVGDCVATEGDCVATEGDCVATVGDCVATATVGDCVATEGDSVVSEVGGVVSVSTASSVVVGAAEGADVSMEGADVTGSSSAPSIYKYIELKPIKRAIINAQERQYALLILWMIAHPGSLLPAERNMCEVSTLGFRRDLL